MVCPVLNKTKLQNEYSYHRIESEKLEKVIDRLSQLFEIQVIRFLYFISDVEMYALIYLISLHLLHFRVRLLSTTELYKFVPPISAPLSSRMLASFLPPSYEASLSSAFRTQSVFINTLFVPTRKSLDYFETLCSHLTTVTKVKE